MNTIQLYRNNNLQPILLPGVLNATVYQDFNNQMINLFAQQIARQVNGVVYVFSTERVIPRLRGESNILYIGKTNQSIYNRHGVQQALNWWYEPRWPLYNYIMQNYGSIEFYYAQVDNPTTMEDQFLEQYLLNHYELPPTNRQK